VRRVRLLQLGLFTASTLLAATVFEIGLRLLVSPSEISYGRLGGGELPPLRVIREDAFLEVDRNRWHDQMVIQGQKITRGDLWGILREHETIGYVPLENATSVNGWWQSNDLGARARRNFAETPATGVRRVLVFGDSFAQGSRLPQEETWTTALDSLSGGSEVVNFGVDGYGMTQSFLRYREVRDRLDYDVALVMFVPSADLVRDINTHRALIGWQASIVLPRFLVEKGRLELVPSLYANLEEVRRNNPHEASAELRRHLRAYDRLYLPAKHESLPIVGNLVLYKLVARAYYVNQEEKLVGALMRSDSEAMQVTRAIFDAMAREVTAEGKRFCLVLLPTDHDVRRYETTTRYRDLWDTMAATMCPDGAGCMDLMPRLRNAPELDRGYDGSHYGPLASEFIAEVVWQGLEPLLEAAGQPVPGSAEPAP
jgi:hypothetical protein